MNIDKILKNCKNVELNHLKGACGVNRIDCESNGSVYGEVGMSVKDEGMNCGVVEVIK